MAQQAQIALFDYKTRCMDSREKPITEAERQAGRESLARAHAKFDAWQRRLQLYDANGICPVCFYPGWHLDHMIKGEIMAEA